VHVGAVHAPVRVSCMLAETGAYFQKLHHILEYNK